ncbi:MAG: CRTAC1 family protein [Armatimonadota bacterium]
MNRLLVSRLAVPTLVTAASLSLAAGCDGPAAARKDGTALAPASASASRPAFSDVTAASGVKFTHNSAASGSHYFVETMGAGVAFLDYDGDGKQDLFFLNGAPLPGYRKSGPMLPALYRNLGARKFQDVTKEAGLAVEMYGMGIAVGDYDHDGDDDLYLTAVLGPSRLFRNDGGRFTDVAKAAGVDRPGSFPTSAAWLDYDKDGDLDLYVCNYVRYRSVADDLPCFFKDGIRSYCIPSAYSPEKDSLYQNQGDGTFKDVAAQAGVEGPDGKSLGVAVWDLNGDTWPDLLVANDTTPTHAYYNRKDGTFEERAAMVGVAYGVTGTAKAGMGIDIADDRNSGLPTVVMSNFSGEMVGLYRADQDGFFKEESVVSGVGKASEKLLGFGIFYFDFNNDGWQDLFVANGHVQDKIEQFSEGITYKQPPLLLANMGGGQFRDVTPDAGEAMKTRLVARGAAFGDIDDDGRLDIAINNNQGPAFLWSNETEGQGNWLKLRLIGTKSNRNGYGARVTLKSSAGTQTREARGGSSYCSQSDQRIHFGLGGDEKAGELVIRWTSGTVDTLRDVPAGQVLTVTEGSHP